jgi:hypothetical protein
MRSACNCTTVPIVVLRGNLDSQEVRSRCAAAYNGTYAATSNPAVVTLRFVHGLVSRTDSC